MNYICDGQKCLNIVHSSLFCIKLTFVLIRRSFLSFFVTQVDNVFTNVIVKVLNVSSLYANHGKKRCYAYLLFSVTLRTSQFLKEVQNFKTPQGAFMFLGLNCEYLFYFI